MSVDALSPHSSLPRIAMVSTHGYVAAVPPLGAADTGGQVVYVLELSKSLARQGYEVDIWTRRFEDQQEVETVSDRVRIIRAECGGAKFIPKEYLHESIPEWWENARGFMRKNGLSYRFINTHYWDAGVAGLLMASALGVPHVHTPHSLGWWKKRQMEADFPGDEQKFELQYNFTVRIETETFIYRTVDLVVATTHPQLALLAEEYHTPREKCLVIPAGFDEDRFFPVSPAHRESTRRRLGLSGTVVMAVGRLARNKGYDLLINAFRHVVRRVPDAVLALDIGGMTRTSVEEEILRGLKKRAEEVGLAERIRFGDFIPDAELANYYRAADVFALSSRYEPFGMTAVEAMACGTPAVVTVHGGLHYVLEYGTHALYADPFDDEDFGITICKVLMYPELRERLSHRGAQEARRHFTWTGIAVQIVSAVQKISYPTAPSARPHRRGDPR